MNYQKYLIRKKESKKNLLLILDCNNEWGKRKEEDFYIGINPFCCKEELEGYPISFYLGFENAKCNNELDGLTFHFVKESLVGVDKKIIPLLEKDLENLKLKVS